MRGHKITGVVYPNAKSNYDPLFDGSDDISQEDLLSDRFQSQIIGTPMIIAHGANKPKCDGGPQNNVNASIRAFNAVQKKGDWTHKDTEKALRDTGDSSALPIGKIVKCYPAPDMPNTWMIDVETNSKCLPNLPDLIARGVFTGFSLSHCNTSDGARPFEVTLTVLPRRKHSSITQVTSPSGNSLYSAPVPPQIKKMATAQATTAAAAAAAAAPEAAASVAGTEAADAAAAPEAVDQDVADAEPDLSAQFTSVVDGLPEDRKMALAEFAAKAFNTGVSSVPPTDAARFADLEKSAKAYKDDMSSRVELLSQAVGDLSGALGQAYETGASPGTPCGMEAFINAAGLNPQAMTQATALVQASVAALRQKTAVNAAISAGGIGRSRPLTATERFNQLTCNTVQHAATTPEFAAPAAPQPQPVLVQASVGANKRKRIETSPEEPPPVRYRPGTGDAFLAQMCMSIANQKDE